MVKTNIPKRIQIMPKPIKWRKTFGEKFKFDSGGCISITNDDEYIFIGYSGSYGGDWNDVWVIKHDDIDFMNNIGELISKNLLIDQYASEIILFNYSARIPNGTNIELQFSQDNISWYNSDGIVNAADLLLNGNYSIDLSSLKWYGSNFYYKAVFSSTNSNVSALQSINFSYMEYLDPDNDNIPNPEDPDDDNDNYLDEWEEFLNTSTKDFNDRPIDSDQDNIPDGNLENSRSWMDPDDDNDNIPDDWEVQYGFDPLNSSDAELDSDDDGLTNKKEYDKNTDPTDPDDPPKKNDINGSTSLAPFIYWILAAVIIILIILALLIKSKKRDKDS